MKLWIAWTQNLEDQKLEVDSKRLPEYYKKGVGEVNLFEGTKAEIFEQLFYGNWTAYLEHGIDEIDFGEKVDSRQLR